MTNNVIVLVGLREGGNGESLSENVILDIN